MLIHIFLTTIMPILVMAAAGFVLDRHFKLDLDTLSKLNFYVVTPAFLFTNLYEFKFSAESSHVLGVNVLILAATILLSIGLERSFRFSRDMGGALRNAISFNNCGNIGVPLITFVYSNSPYLGADGSPLFLHAALQVQIVVLVLQNVATNSFGFYFAGQGRLTSRAAFLLVMRMPMIYAVIAGGLLNWLQIDIHPTFVWPVIKTFSDALIMVALFTLGVQLARTPFVFVSRNVLIGVAGRLLGGPIVAVICVFFYELLLRPMGVTFSPITNQVLLISAAVPSGVNTALIAAAMHNHPEYATQLVMATTIFSAVTLPFIIWLAHSAYPAVM